MSERYAKYGYNAGSNPCNELTVTRNAAWPGVPTLIGRAGERAD